MKELLKITQDVKKFLWNFSQPLIFNLYDWCFTPYANTIYVTGGNGIKPLVKPRPCAGFCKTHVAAYTFPYVCSMFVQLQTEYKYVQPIIFTEEILLFSLHATLNVEEFLCVCFCSVLICI